MGDSLKTWSTTAEVAAAAGVSGVTVMDWARRGVLPSYIVVHGGRRGRSARWPQHAPEQAKWVKTRLDAGLTFEEIKASLERGDFEKPQG